MWKPRYLLSEDGLSREGTRCGMPKAAKDLLISSSHRKGVDFVFGRSMHCINICPGSLISIMSGTCNTSLRSTFHLEMYLFHNVPRHGVTLGQLRSVHIGLPIYKASPLGLRNNIEIVGGRSSAPAPREDNWLFDHQLTSMSGV